MRYFPPRQTASVAGHPTDGNPEGFRVITEPEILVQAAPAAADRELTEVGKCDSPKPRNPLTRVPGSLNKLGSRERSLALRLWEIIRTQRGICSRGNGKTKYYESSNAGRNILAWSVPLPQSERNISKFMLHWTRPRGPRRAKMGLLRPI